MKYYITHFDIHTENAAHESAETIAIAKDLIAGIMGECGYESFEETTNGVDGYIQTNLYDEENVNGTLEYFPMDNIHITFTTEDTEDKNWNETWENTGFEPITVGNIYIHDTIHTSGANDILPDNSLIDITIDTKQAFGTGTHETTKMIVEKLQGIELNDKSVLDCGCGTGILSIVAAKCGAKDITGYDIDEWSVRNTLHNANINNTENIKVKLGDVNVLDSINESFDVILANINRNILINDMPKIRQKLKSDGIVIISGFYEEDVTTIEDNFRKLGLVCMTKKTTNRWTMMVLGNK